MGQVPTEAPVALVPFGGGGGLKGQGEGVAPSRPPPPLRYGPTRQRDRGRRGSVGSSVTFRCHIPNGKALQSYCGPSGSSEGGHRVMLWRARIYTAGAQEGSCGIRGKVTLPVPRPM